jgi:hypothetical protein
MSLESQIADLVTATNSLITVFNSKKAGIDSALAAAIAAAPETTRSWYVDQVNGLDTNVGSSALPFRTIEKAISSTPGSGVCGIFLLSDYEFTSQINITCSLVVLKGEGGTRVLKPKYFQVTDVPTGIVTTQLGGFVFQRHGCSMEIREVSLMFPTIAGVNPVPVGGRLCAFLKTYGTFSMPPMMGVNMAIVTVTKAADWVGSLISSPASCIALGCYAVSFPGDFGGKYIDGIAAATDTKTLTRVVTNLSAL